ncbi:MAG: GGDEF domain-containing protein [Myxococcales bacterium]|nr:MAG: GGDEF domain-containing protein [Myxococcales bacterium]
MDNNTKNKNLPSSPSDYIRHLGEAALVLDKSLEPIAHNAAFVASSGLSPHDFIRQSSEGRSITELVSINGAAGKSMMLECLQKGYPQRITQAKINNATGSHWTSDVSFIPIRSEEDGAEALIQIIHKTLLDERDESTDLLTLYQAQAASLQRELEERTRDLNIALQQVDRLAMHDSLTGLLNRNAFLEHAQKALELARRHDRALAILICDLDGFKQINESYGHKTGDKMLVAFANALDNTLRKSDTVARVGGEEFAVLLSETHSNSVREVAQRCAKAIRDVVLEGRHGSMRLNQSVSIGVAIFPAHGRTLDEVISRSEEALHLAKETGRDRVVIYDNEMLKTAPKHDAFKKPKVLLVSSDAPCAKHISSQLSPLYKAVHALSLKEATEQCKANLFDIIIC